MPSNIKLHFFGGAGIVTGANYLIEVDSGSKKSIKFLIDCGMFQGLSHIEEKNREDFPFNPKEIDFVLITHAHLDHIGRLPKLCRDGFRGKILATAPTIDFTRLILYDAQGISERQAREKRTEPLYTQADVENALKLMKKVEYGKKIRIKKGISCRFLNAGHILGSAIIEIWLGTKKIVFSGDLGNPPVPLLDPPEFIDQADYVVIESLYGDRIHETAGQRKDLLENAIEDTITRGGTLLMPSFALERTQELLYELNELVENHRIPNVPVFFDSPLAIKALEVYKKYPQYYNKEASYLIKSGDDLFKFPRLVFTRTVEESKQINDVAPPKIIIAGSGTLSGGRILYHAIRYLPDPKSTILFVSFQTEGTTGRKIINGDKQVRIFNETIPVRAEVRLISGYSAHADREMLRDWIDKIKRPIKQIFAVQGEEGPALALIQLIEDHLGIPASAPKLGEVIEL
jgi:metallo-beta-lactamase family protein